MTETHVTLAAADGGTFDAYLTTPAAPNGGAIVVLQEIFGINPYIRSVCDDLSAQGFYAIAPDLFWRQARGVELNGAVAEDLKRAMALSQALDHGLAVADALVAAEHARGLPGSNGRVGAIGFCLGGKLAYDLATKPQISAAASYYGVAIQQSLDRMSAVQCPLILHVAQNDHLCPPEAQAKIAEAAAARDAVQVIAYPGVGHGFARRGPMYDPAAAQSANAATIKLMMKTLAGD